MGVCRVCGAECAPDDLLAVHEGGGCVNCNGSPACTRCGHARRQHRGTFGGGDAGCNASVTPELGLALARCGCGGYTTEAAALWEPVRLVDVSELAPVRDLFDEERDLDDIAEFDGVPWPAS